VWFCEFNLIDRSTTPFLLQGGTGAPANPIFFFGTTNLCCVTVWRSFELCD